MYLFQYSHVNAHKMEDVYVKESSWFDRSTDRSTSRQSALWALEEEEEEVERKKREKKEPIHQ
jgi:hypothetical protein